MSQDQSQNSNKPTPKHFSTKIACQYTCTSISAGWKDILPALM